MTETQKTMKNTAKTYPFQRIENPRVPGSIPGVGTGFSRENGPFRSSRESTESTEYRGSGDRRVTGRFSLPSLKAAGRSAVVRGVYLLLALAAVLALVSGCASGPREYIVGDPAFTTSERGRIEAGREYLMAATGRSIPEIRWEALPVGDEHNTITRGSLAVDVIGIGDEGDFRLTLDADQVAADGADLAAVAAHELGHGIGLEHHDAAGLMNPRTTALSWTDADEGQCVAKGVCR